MRSGRAIRLVVVTVALLGAWVATMSILTLLGEDTLPSASQLSHPGSEGATGQVALQPGPKEATVITRQTRPLVNLPHGTSTVEIVDHNGTPVIGAAVRVIPLPQNLGDDWRSNGTLIRELLFGKHNVEELAHSDDIGQIVINSAPYEALLFCETDTLWGLGRISCESPSSRLQLLPRYALGIVVVDFSGHPVMDWPVSISIPELSQDDTSQELITDSNGYCESTLIGQLEAYYPEFQLVARADNPLGDNAISLIPSLPSANNLILRLPAAGSVRVMLVDNNGAPSLGSFNVRMSYISSVADTFPKSYSNLPSMLAPTENVATFSRVSVGKRLMIQASSSSGQEASCIVDGLQFDGQTLNTRLCVGDLKPRLIVRFLIDGASAPNLGVRGKVTFNSPSGSHVHEFESRTSTSGTVAVGPRQGFGNSTVWFGEFYASEATGQVLVGKGDGVLSGLNEEACTVDIVLRPEPVPASGRTVTESGEPLRGARVTLWEGIQGSGRWMPRNDLAIATDSEGRFTLQVPDRGTLVRMIARYPGRCAAVREIVPGQQEIEIELPVESTVSGGIVTDFPLSKNQLIAELSQTELAESPLRLDSEISEDGTFLLRGVRQGTYSFALLSRNSREVLWTLDSIHVGRSEDYTDSRLNAINLEGLVFEYQIEVHDSLGHMVSNALIKVESEDGFRRELHSQRQSSSSVTLVTKHPEVRIFVSVPGQEAISLTATPGSVTVKLE